MGRVERVGTVDKGELSMILEEVACIISIGSEVKGDAIMYH